MLWESQAQMKNGFLSQEPYSMSFVFVFDLQCVLYVNLKSHKSYFQKIGLREGLKHEFLTPCKILFDSYLSSFSFLLIHLSLSMLYRGVFQKDQKNRYGHKVDGSLPNSSEVFDIKAVKKKSKVNLEPSSSKSYHYIS